MNLTDHVTESIKLAIQGQSFIDDRVKAMRGFATRTQRHLVNNLARGPIATYLEVGLFAGATFCSAAINNTALHAFGIENGSQDFNSGQDVINGELTQNLAGLRKDRDAKWKLYIGDCFQHQEKLPAIDFYYYDGEHSEESQAKALPHFFDRMADEFIFMVDDTNWPFVAAGTEKGFKALEGILKIEERWHLQGQGIDSDPVWWNGVDIFVISKI